MLALARGTKVVASATALAIVGLAASASVASAATITYIPLTNQYNVAFTPVALSGGSYKYTFQITNLTQNLGSQTGLDGFFIAVPHGATVSSVVSPPPYTSGSWTWSQSQDPADPTEDLIKFWGNSPQSVYPLHTIATFSLVTNSIIASDEPINLVSFWGSAAPNVAYTHTTNGNYSYYSSAVAAPVSAPEPASLGLLGLGGFALLAARRRRR